MHRIPKRVVAVTLLATLLWFPHSAVAERGDPLDPYSTAELFGEGLEEEDKSPGDLVAEANALLDRERLIDARSKLLAALKKDPSYYQAHMMLAGYYMIHVGHFRLAFKYVHRALELFVDKNGSPPYTDRLRRAEHANLLYLLSQIRLNLDNYQGSLDTLDEYKSFGYYSSWYAGTRAWVLMKLGRLEEAIKEARMGLLLGAESGRTLNMLGILLSMHGEPDSALRVFRQAIQYELSMGSSGQPATPLNNSGEVYKELYEEDKAESAWVQSKSLPDGCEHVLPSLNLTLLYIDQTKYREASQSIDSFLTCFAQFPLKNGEEHQALVHLARGRIATHAGSPELGSVHLEKALEDIQWFGKIGTSKGDLKAGALVSLALSLEFAKNQQSQTPNWTWRNVLIDVKRTVIDSVRIWWLRRRALQILIEDLENIEDLRVRNTDSLLEYPTLGTVLRKIPPSTLRRRIEFEKEQDPRSESLPYYEAYLAESLLEHGSTEDAMALIRSILAHVRIRYDDGLRLHLSALLMQNLSSSSEEYINLAKEMYMLAPASLYNYGLKLPVALSSDDSKVSLPLEDSPFLPVSSSNSLGSLSVTKDSETITIELRTSRDSVRVSGAKQNEVLEEVVRRAFSEDIGPWLTSERLKAVKRDTEAKEPAS